MIDFVVVVAVATVVDFRLDAAEWGGIDSSSEAAAVQCDNAIIWEICRVDSVLINGLTLDRCYMKREPTVPALETRLIDL